MKSIVAQHVPPDREVIDLRPGEEVTVGRRDDQWPLWLWCSNEHGAGWVPEAFLKIHENVGTAKRAYTTRELAVRPGDQVEPVESYGGWTFVRRGDGEQGWIPDGCLACS